MIEMYTGLSADYFIIGALAAAALLLILVIILFAKLASLRKKLNVFMTGSDVTSLEDTLIARLSQVDELIASNNENERNIEDIKKQMKLSVDKFAIVKYDALEELGGKLSYVLCMLDQRDNGFILNNMHGRDGSYSYLKEVINGNTVSTLSDEEKTALNKAISGEDR